MVPKIFANSNPRQTFPIQGVLLCWLHNTTVLERPFHHLSAICVPATVDRKKRRFLAFVWSILCFDETLWHVWFSNFWHVTPKHSFHLQKQWCAWRVCASAREHNNNVAWRVCASWHERYCLTPPHPTPTQDNHNVAWRVCASAREDHHSVAWRVWASAREDHHNVAWRVWASAREDHHNVAWRVCASAREHNNNVAWRVWANWHECHCPTPPHPTPPQDNHNVAWRLCASWHARPSKNEKIAKKCLNHHGRLWVGLQLHIYIHFHGLPSNRDGTWLTHIKTTSEDVCVAHLHWCPISQPHRKIAGTAWWCWWILYIYIYQSRKS